MVWNIAIPAITSIAGGLLSSSSQREAADKAADAQVASSNKAIAEQRRQFDQLMALNAPTQHYGNEANALLGMNYGITPYDQSGGGASSNVPPVSASPAPNRPQQMDQWNAYYGANPDLQRAYGSNAARVQDRFSNPTDFAEWHFNTFGRGEGRELPSVGGPAPQPQPQAPTSSGNVYAASGRDLTGTPAAPGAQSPSPEMTPQDYQGQLYDRFEGSGEYRSIFR